MKEEIKGVLELFHRTELELNEESLKFLHALASQAAIAIDNSSLFNDLQQSNAELIQAYDVTIEGWSQALDLRDDETEGHTQRVMELTTKLGTSIRLVRRRAGSCPPGCITARYREDGRPGWNSAQTWAVDRGRMDRDEKASYFCL